jgi:toxin FitB
VRYLFDTNALSETVKPSPNALVIEWLGGLDYANCYISVLTLGEIRKGVERLPASARREKFRQWLEVALPKRFSGNVLSVTLEVADRWGRLVADMHRQPLLVADSLIAATALAHGLTLVTRDAAFERVAGLLTFNPWAIEN